eukprot:CAMPEP_0170315204 /NCGR_PEP_ID=MMETSP0116_2-20130129/58193_1 /TAXON_ID=400756 /ORGANISM="Durinskia baltica, Strain CSIRO CS-38" /LENGTH=31 /DNA_ID= /DNA_START= /DNA_END= /DNA_ORIENTATION=
MGATLTSGGLSRQGRVAADTKSRREGRHVNT